MMQNKTTKHKARFKRRAFLMPFWLGSVESLVSNGTYFAMGTVVYRQAVGVGVKIQLATCAYGLPLHKTITVKDAT